MIRTVTVTRIPTDGPLPGQGGAVGCKGQAGAVGCKGQAGAVGCKGQAGAAGGVSGVLPRMRIMPMIANAPR
jgi:hypothetical protein